MKFTLISWDDHVSNMFSLDHSEEELMLLIELFHLYYRIDKKIEKKKILLVDKILD